ncbi:hypothetical protein [Streptomyces phaeochromogenes]|uniref:hypothetical protein n=1 Tax=Streptomyces phaeochromogenes TaxID=1923 RepID=UPI00386DDAAF|nr:hypothetical protein OHB08_33435 [Streptomyces phaeochromogenes]
MQQDGVGAVSPMWDDEPERAAGTCVACGLHTDDGIVRWLPRMSGPDVRLIVHAEAGECTPREPAAPPLRLRRIGHSV